MVISCTSNIDVYQEAFQVEKLSESKSDWQSIMFSSYDRTGGNDDGFNGTYSKLRIENGNSILAEVEGGGYIGRIWFPDSRIDQSGLLNLEGEHIKIYLDNKDVPEFDLPIEDLFTGKQEGFPVGLVGKGLGGYFCYVPIPFSNYCKVEVEGTGVKFYQINIQKYAGQKIIECYRKNNAQTINQLLESSGKKLLKGGVIANGDCYVTSLDILSGETKSFEIKNESAQIVGFQLETTPDKLEQLLKSRIRFFWDGNSEASIDLQVNMFFAIADSLSFYQSLIAGFSGGKLYNNLPMPFFQNAKIEIESSGNIHVKISYTLSRRLSDNVNYLTAFYNEEVPANDPGRSYTWLNIEGEGHYVGTFLMTEGQTVSEKHLPVWLEGDEVFICDAEMNIHGTGTEDYFNCGWYGVPGRLYNSGSFPLHGFSQYEMDTIGKASAYRWHVNDPVPFKKSIQVSVEHGTNNTVEANYKSTAFYYLNANGKGVK